MDSIKSIIYSVLQGCYDSVRGIFVIAYLDREMNKKLDDKIASKSSSLTTGTSKKSAHKETKKEKRSNVAKRVLQCCLLNGGVFLLSILFFDYVLLPLLRALVTYFLDSSSVWNFIQITLSGIFDTIWVVPLFLLSKIINTFWFQDIADAAYEFRQGRRRLIPSISKLFADVVFSLIVQTLFLIQSLVVSYVPYFGSSLSFLHICILYSLYSFEYKWFNQGVELHHRLTLIEKNWPYFIGFGLPLALMTQLCNSFFISGCIFSIFFPLFILSANESSPQKRIDFQLRFFSLVVTVSNSLVKKKLTSQTTLNNKSITMQSR